MWLKKLDMESDIQIDSTGSTCAHLHELIIIRRHNGTNTSSIVAFSYGGTADILASPFNSSNPIVRSAANYLSARYGHRMLSLGNTHDEDVSLVGQKFYIDTVRLSQSPYDALNLVRIPLSHVNPFAFMYLGVLMFCIL